MEPEPEPVVGPAVAEPEDGDAGGGTTVADVVTEVIVVSTVVEEPYAGGGGAGLETGVVGTGAVTDCELVASVKP
jgi:hypothetical protein